MTHSFSQANISQQWWHTGLTCVELKISSHVWPLHRVMANALSQQVFSVSFIPLEGIYTWAAVRLHTHCSVSICQQFCWREKMAPWHWKLQHPGFVAEVIGSNIPLCSKAEQKDLPGVCLSTYLCSSARMWLIQGAFTLFQPIWLSQLLCHVHKWMTVNARSPW